jgi:hypothetical protein
MAKRKTFSVDEMKDMVNDICKTTHPDYVAARQTAMTMLEDILHKTGNYAGYRSLLEGECEGNPGVRYLGNVPHPDFELRFKDTDRTRVMYF